MAITVTQLCCSDPTALSFRTLYLPRPSVQAAACVPCLSVLQTETIISLSCVWLLSCSVMSNSFQLYKTCQAPLPMEFSRQKYWSGLPFPPPGDLPNSGLNSYLLHLLHWQVDSLPLCHLGSPFYMIPLFITTSSSTFVYTYMFIYVHVK